MKTRRRDPLSPRARFALVCAVSCAVIIERFRSMQALKDFWYSDGYQEAKKLRKGVAKLNFIIALEGVPASEQ